MQIPLKQYVLLLKQYLRPQGPRVALLAVLLAASIGLQLFSPQILRQFIDLATAGAGGERLASLALLFIAAALVNQVLTVMARYTGEMVAWTATNNLRADLAEHCLRLDATFQKQKTPGEMIERIDGDVTALTGFFSQFAIDLLANGVLMAGVLVLLFQEDWRAGLAMTLFALTTLLVLSTLRRWATGLQAQTRQQTALLFGTVGEHLAGTEDLRANGARSYAMRRFYGLYRTWVWTEEKANLGPTSLWGSSVFLFAAGSGVALVTGGWLWRTGAISLGAVYLIFHYTELLRRPLEQIRTQLQDLQKASASITRVQGLLQTASRIQDGPGALLPPGPLALRFDQLSFHYEDDAEPVLRGIDFELKPGAVMGLLGRTGSGKTTLARLLLRLYDPTEGEVRLGGTPIRQATVAALRTAVGYVTQEVQLFEASVRHNLTFFDPAIPDDRILTALVDLGLGDWFRTLPHGLDTELGAGGVGLSAGEAQLLAFARVFLRNPSLVILDEASSRLDPATEALAERAITRLLQGRTGIIIAHRLATVQRADQILILEQGQVLEYGDRQALAADPDSRFHQLLQTGLEEVLA